VLESVHEGIALLVMNRPERLNSLNSELAVGLNEALGRAAENRDVRVVVITGAGRVLRRGDLALMGKGGRAGMWRASSRCFARGCKSC